MADFEILDPIVDIEVIAVGTKIRELPRLEETYGNGRWRKLKGTAQVRLQNGDVAEVEVHWYEAHGRGRHEHKIKRFLD